MLVKDVVLSSVMKLGRADLVEYLATGNSENVESAKRDIDSLVMCFNNIENEIALDYVPLKKSEECTPVGNKIYFSTLSVVPIEILSVSNVNGQKVDFKIFPEYLQTVNENVNVVYSYSPSNKTIDSTSDYTGEVSVRLLSYGVATEFSVINGSFEEASYWDKRYKEAISNITLKKPIGRIVSRSWI